MEFILHKGHFCFCFSKEKPEFSGVVSKADGDQAKTTSELL